MKWHAKGQTNNGVLRHLTDRIAWKTFDSQYNDFAFDPCNVKLWLSTNRFNHFGNMIISYSFWPVMLISYNLLPWMCMTQSTFMLIIDNLSPIFTLYENICIPRASNSIIEAIMGGSRITNLWCLLCKNAYDACGFGVDNQWLSCIW